MLIMGFSGGDIDKHSPVVKWLQEDNLGGVLLFDIDLKTKSHGKNLQNTDQIKRLTGQLNRYAMRSQFDLPRTPIFIAIDYEGGVVDRLSNIDGCMKTMSALNQALLTDHDLYLEAGKMAETLKDLGFNLNFAPIVDLNLSTQEGIIGRLNRSFSDQPAEVIRAARTFVKAFSHYGITCAYKHFPGHGSAFGDTHHGFVDVTEVFDAKELLPYVSLLNDHSLPAMVMTAHVINRQLDKSGLPATLSFPVLSELLRQNIGFDGVIVSDDLQMQAISQHYPLDDVLKLTINAGADMLIFANQLGDITATEVVDKIECLVNSGAIDTNKIERSNQRILSLKDRVNRCELTTT
jgi:beta-N-acetylhexosaminidase